FGLVLDLPDVKVGTPNPPNAGGMIGNPGMIGGGPPPPPGGVGGSAPPPGAGIFGGAPPGPGGSPAGGLIGGGAQGGTPPVGGAPGDKADGTLRIALVRDTIYSTLDLHLTEETYKGTRSFVRDLLPTMKGMSDLASSHMRVHELAAALQAYVKEKGEFPRGT